MYFNNLYCLNETLISVGKGNTGRNSNAKRNQHTRQRQGWANQEEYRIIAWACSVGTGKAKPQLKLKVVRDMIGSKERLQ